MPFTPKLRHILAERMRAEYAARGLSWATLSKASGLSMSTIARISAARHPPDLDTLEKLAYGIGIEASELLKPL